MGGWAWGGGSKVCAHKDLNGGEVEQSSSQPAADLTVGPSIALPLDRRLLVHFGLPIACSRVCQCKIPNRVFLSACLPACLPDWLPD